MTRTTHTAQMLASLAVAAVIVAAAIVVVTSKLGPTSVAELEAREDRRDARIDLREERRERRQELREERRERRQSTRAVMSLLRA